MAKSKAKAAIKRSIREHSKRGVPIRPKPTPPKRPKAKLASDEEPKR